MLMPFHMIRLGAWIISIHCALGLLPCAAQPVTVSPAELVQSWPQTDGSPVTVNLALSAIPADSNTRISASTDSGGNWLIVSPSAVGAGQSTLSVLLDPSGLPDGTYTGSLKIGGQPTIAATEVPVTIMIGDPGPQLPRSGIVNYASLQTGALAPGEIVGLSGSELGPHIPYSAQIWDAVVAAKIAGTRVWFDDTLAPLLYALPNQVVAVVPSDVAGKRSVKVRVENMVARSLPVTVPVQEAVPALFTTSYTGKGPVAAVNQNSRANSGANPAPSGSIVTLYATGAGPMDPPLPDGTIVSSEAASRLVLPVSVTIGGQPAEVLSAGASPQAVPGLLQINVRIPLNAGKGAVSVALIVGGFRSPDGCTIFIR